MFGTYVTLAAPDQPVRSCPEWKRCENCQGGVAQFADGPCPCCNASGIVEAATGAPI